MGRPSQEYCDREWKPWPVHWRCYARQSVDESAESYRLDLKMYQRSAFLIGLTVLGPSLLRAQESDAAWWTLHAQATYIPQGYGAFPALYTGPNSLKAGASTRRFENRDAVFRNAPLERRRTLR